MARHFWLWGAAVIILVLIVAYIGTRPAAPYVSIAASAIALYVGDTLTVTVESDTCIGYPILDFQTRDLGSPEPMTLISIYPLGKEVMIDTNASEILEPVSIQGKGQNAAVAILRARARGNTELSAMADGENHCHPPGVSQTHAEFSKGVTIVVKS